MYNMKHLLAVCASILIIFLTGCGGEKITGATLPIISPTSVEVTVSTDKSSYNLSENVKCTLSVKNISPATIEVIFTSSQMYDFIVQKASNVIWRWSQDKVFLTVLTPFVLEPGSTEVFSEIWSQKDNDGNNVLSGSYFLTGYLENETSGVSSTEYFSIE